MHCPSCSAVLTDDARFCIHCGMSLAPPTLNYNQGMFCPQCGGDGSGLPASKVYCSQCRWLRPLYPGYELPIEAFLWRLDADAMNVLRNLGPLTMAAHAISERIGRPWFEASVNGLRLSEKQIPEIFNLAIRAGRIIGLQYLPEIYISGDQMWDAATLGSDASAFIVIGSVLINFKEEELLFVLGREMGHCRAGHALWKTVSQFITGRSHKRSIAGDGLLKLLNPAKLVENAIDAPLMAWARHAEITADSAGLIVVGKEDVARRVLQAWTFRSFPLLQRVNPEAWMEQEDASDAGMTQLAEWTLASAPYIAGRLRLMREFARSDYLKQWRAVIEHYAPMPAAGTAPAPGAPNTPPANDPNTIRLVCITCKESMRVPATALAGTATVNVRCPNPKCRAVLSVTPKPTAPVTPPPVPPTPPAPPPDTLRLICAGCKQPMRIPASVIAGKESVNVRCPACKVVLVVKPKATEAPPAPPAPPPAPPAAGKKPGSTPKKGKR
jgi:Zn-dependent protease with chaperone function